MSEHAPVGANAGKVVTALRANWWLSSAGLLLSFCASIVLVRVMSRELYAQYATLLAMIGLATLLFEAGANSGLTRYMKEAAEAKARATFYLGMRQRRWYAAFACSAALLVFGPMYAKASNWEALGLEPLLFVGVSAVVVAGLLRLLAHYGLLALFEAKSALLLQQGFLVGRALLLAAVAWAGGGIMALLAALLAVNVLEAFLVHRRLWSIIRKETGRLPPGFLNKAQGFGVLTVFDKACAALGSGSVLLLVFAPRHDAVSIAFLALAVELVGKLVSLTVMPMGNLVAPYLAHTSDESQGTAVAKVLKLSCVLYSASVSAGLLLLPGLIEFVYGQRYEGAVPFALVLLAPTAFENWIRGCCSPALLRNGHYRQLALVNVTQALVTLLSLYLGRNLPLVWILLIVGINRSLVAAINLVLIRRMLLPGTWRGPLWALGAGLAGYLGGATAGLLGSTPLNRLLLQAGGLGVFFWLGARWLFAQDCELGRIAHKLVGRRMRLPAWVLPRYES